MSNHSKKGRESELNRLKKVSGGAVGIGGGVTSGGRVTVHDGAVRSRTDNSRVEQSNVETKVDAKVNFTLIPK